MVIVSAGHRSRVDPGGSFEPTYLREMVVRLKSDAAYKGIAFLFSALYTCTFSKLRKNWFWVFSGRQEDAEEFLLALLNGLQEELIAVMEFDPCTADKAAMVSDMLVHGMMACVHA